MGWIGHLQMGMGFVFGVAYKRKCFPTAIEYRTSKPAEVETCDSVTWISFCLADSRSIPEIHFGYKSFCQRRLMCCCADVLPIYMMHSISLPLHAVTLTTATPHSTLDTNLQYPSKDHKINHFQVVTYNYKSHKRNLSLPNTELLHSYRKANDEASAEVTPSARNSNHSHLSSSQYPFHFSLLPILFHN